MMLKMRNAAGTTLVEVLVALAVFAAFISILYPAFSFLNAQISSINDKELLNQRGERVINYLGEEIRMIGFLTGSNPGVTFCGTAGVNALVHTNGDPYHSLAFLTSIHIEPTAAGTPFFETTADASSGNTTITVNTTPAYVSTEFIDLTGSGNAMALVTFNTLAPTILQKVYEISSYAGNTVTFTLGLAQQLNGGSTIFGVRRKEIIVNTASGNRDLQIAGWDKDCNQTSMTENIYSSVGPGNEFGGVDGLQFEYTLDDGSVVSSVAGTDLPNLMAVTVWVLVKAGFPSRDYTDSSSYTLGTASPVTVGPFNDEYRRMLLRKTVEVKNLVF